jgi:hypothetical protein
MGEQRERDRQASAKVAIGIPAPRAVLKGNNVPQGRYHSLTAAEVPFGFWLRQWRCEVEPCSGKNNRLRCSALSVARIES